MVIVAAVDQTNNAQSIVAEGRKLADAFDEELHVLHVLPQSEFADMEQEEVKRTGQPGGRKSGKETAAEIAAELAELTIEEFTPVGLIGDPSTQIVHYAEENDVHYIVLGGRKRSPIGKAVFGSTTQSVLMNTNQKVVTIMRNEN